MQAAFNAFDSGFYGIKVGRLVPDPSDGSDDLVTGLESARAQDLDVVFLRLSEEHQLCSVMTAAGHAPVDTLITSTLVPHEHRPGAASSARIEHHSRLADPRDIEAVEVITSTSIRTSHLHADPLLPADQTRELYRSWAHNDVTGRAQHVIVARLGSVLAGYIAVVETERTAVIDLIAVDRGVQRSGIGRALLDAFVAWVGTRDLIASVGTQAINPALRLYARCGFVPTARHFTYHFWLAVP